MRPIGAELDAGQIDNSLFVAMYRYELGTVGDDVSIVDVGAWLAGVFASIFGLVRLMAFSEPVGARTNNTNTRDLAVSLKRCSSSAFLTYSPASPILPMAPRATERTTRYRTVGTLYTESWKTTKQNGNRVSKTGQQAPMLHVTIQHFEWPLEASFWLNRMETLDGRAHGGIQKGDTVEQLGLKDTNGEIGGLRIFWVDTRP
ncbi:hypothetical protein P280DRAFT_513978 [Massarina eburnea CBS 473.64]|uniref:Uncharacterized protein n=1 Tax=Massarina eburnea CBS 473.64 TaxID=1395130 RepID=A0A6A6S9T7_9PLEO|nr:hypothetical protein P280DRAFT_513978 [Massarina eburnea CBS 473.64]